MTIRLIESSPSFFITPLPPPQTNCLRRILSSLRKEITTFVDPSINIKHIKATNLSIPLEKIPDSIQIELLQEMFQEINFDRPNLPGYMPPSSRKDDGFTYTPKLLKNSLDRFLMRMQEKTAFSGSPPENTTELRRFFTHIEQTMRICIYRVTKNYDEFMLRLGGVPPDPKDSLYKTYEDLLEAKARLVIDIAFTGEHCAGRFMGTAIELYQNLRTKQEPESSLQSSLFNTLANLRERTANAQIARSIDSLNSSFQQAHTTHAIASYMATLGPTLGLPGTENCIESSMLIPIKKSRMLRDFFQLYTKDSITNEIEEEIKSSQQLRESIIDWIKEQVETWKEQEYIEIALSLWQELQQIKQTDTSPLLNTILLWKELLDHLLFIKAQLPSDSNNWKNFVVEVISLEESKAFLKQKNLNLQYRIQLQQDLSSSSMETLCKDTLPLETLKQKTSQINKAKMINKTILAKGFPILSEETLMRCLEGKANLQEVLKEHLTRARQVEFIQTLHPFTIDPLHPPKLRPDILNWILTSLEILYY